jgi:hypothetical protein
MSRTPGRCSTTMDLARLLTNDASTFSPSFNAQMGSGAISGLLVPSCVAMGAARTFVTRRAMRAPRAFPTTCASIRRDRGGEGALPWQQPPVDGSTSRVTDASRVLRHMAVVTPRRAGGRRRGGAPAAVRSPLRALVHEPPIAQGRRGEGDYGRGLRATEYEADNAQDESRLHPAAGLRGRPAAFARAGRGFSAR